MTDAELKKLAIPFQISDVATKFMRQLRQTTESVTHVYHSVINYNADKIPPLQTDTLPIVIEDPYTETRPELIKDRTLLWLFKKAFEELIIGLTDSLIEAHKFAKLNSLSIQSKQQPIFSSKEEVETAIEKINKRPLGLNFPTLIEEIETELGIALPLKEEIISINQVRNCLVHRNGIVSDKDINYLDGLRLCYHDLVTISERDGEIFEIKWEHKIKKDIPITRIGIDVKQKTIIFNKGDRVILDQNIFNGVAYTGITFTQTLFNLLPRPTD